MGLVKRGNMWWMSFMYQGQQVRRSTGTADKTRADVDGTARPVSQ